MATQNQTQKTSTPKNGMIHCAHCGEEYSSTYRRCPFCDEVSRPVARRAAAAGGASKAGATSAEGKRRPPARAGGAAYARTSRLSQIIFLVVTLSLIISACVVIGKVIGPMMGTKPDETKPSTSQVGEGTVAPSTAPPASTEAPTIAPIVTGLTLSHSDVTLAAGENFTITPTVQANEDVTVTWSVDKSEIATVTSDGTVLNTNTSGASEIVQVSATAGDITVSCIVRCKSSGGSAPTGTTAPTGDVTGTGTIYNAGNGLNIRTEPSTSGEVIASLANGNTVTILEKVDSDWYKISFDGTGGVTQTGYCSTNYVR